MSFAFGTLIVVWFLGCLVFMQLDIIDECRFQTAEAEHDELLDELWGDE